LHFIVERCRSLSPHMPTRTSALRRIGRVIILHDPFFSRAAASEGSMVVSTVQARGVGLSQRHQGTEGGEGYQADSLLMAVRA